MQVTTTWVKPPRESQGLDHLAVQEPCASLYQRLLPGITNVTDRARYYAFYPWFIWAFDQRRIARTREDFERLLRRADCLFTLIAERHARRHPADDLDRHGLAMTGRDILRPALDLLKTGSNSLQLSTYATQEDTGHRYFKNRLGGLGQYYQGVLQELGILEERQGILHYTQERGERLARAMDSCVNRERFFQVLEADNVTLARLDELESFCPCQLLHSTAEHQYLCDLFFNRELFYQAEGTPRRLSLALLLDLVRALSEWYVPSERYVKLDLDTYLGCVYTGYLPDKIGWQVPEGLIDTRRGWALYVRNELLAVALQGLFYAALDLLKSIQAPIFLTSRACADWLLTTTTTKAALAGRDHQTFAAAVQEARTVLPPLAEWQAPAHEFALRRRLLASQRSGPDHAALLRESLQLLIALAVRDDKTQAPYESFIYPDTFFSYYPLNLVSLRHQAEGDWQNLSLRDWLAWLICHWGIETHLQVALRKLRHQSTDTFRIRPTDQGLQVVSPPVPVRTIPRFTQAVRILRDIGAITRDPAGLWQLTERGQALLEEVNGRRAD